ncbi:MAG: cyclic nucleotide-binding domain-containing protein [Deltaproteobacteria bacterium]|nr:cyclic nucleotide-binding domain-containing protein [Deltaproteobacteria bacterium]
MKEPPEQVHQALSRNFLFADLNDDEITVLANEVWLERIPAHSTIVRENDDADALYLVVEGGVNVTKKDGRFLAYLGHDGFFGEMAIFTEGAKRSATCTTSLDTTFAVIRKESFEQYCENNAASAIKIYRAIIRTMAERLQATSADLAALMATQIKAQSSIDSIVEKARKKKQEKAL